MSTEHDNYEDQILALISGELEPKAAQALRDDLKHRPELMEKLEAWALISEATRTPMIAPDPRVAEVLQKAAKRAVNRQHRDGFSVFFQLLSATPSFASVGVVVIMSSLLFLLFDDGQDLAFDDQHSAELIASLEPQVSNSAEAPMLKSRSEGKGTQPVSQAKRRIGPGSSEVNPKALPTTKTTSRGQKIDAAQADSRLLRKRVSKSAVPIRPKTPPAALSSVNGRGRHPLPQSTALSRPIPSRKSNPVLDPTASLDLVHDEGVERPHVTALPKAPLARQSDQIKSPKPGAKTSARVSSASGAVVLADVQSPERIKMPALEGPTQRTSVPKPVGTESMAAAQSKHPSDTNGRIALIFEMIEAGRCRQAMTLMQGLVKSMVIPLTKQKLLFEIGGCYEVLADQSRARDAYQRAAAIAGPLRTPALQAVERLGQP